MNSKWWDMVAYISEHPYLQLPPILAERCGSQCRAELERLRAQNASGSPAGGIVAEEQRTLDVKVAVVMRLLRERPAYRLGFVPSDPGVGTLLVSMFVHAGWLHIIGNMLFFFLSGPFVEDLFGRPLFAGLYLLSGLGGAYAQLLSNPASVIPLVGASGAIAGIMGAFLVRLTAARIRFLFVPIILLPTFRFTFFLPAFVVIPTWFLEQLWYAQQGEGVGGVAWWAHVGGFLCGATVAIGVRAARFEERVIHPAIERRISITQHPGIEAAMEFLARGQWNEARRRIEEVLAEEPRNLDAWQVSYEVALETRDMEAAGRSAMRLLDLYVREDEPELAERLVEEALGRVEDGLPTRFYLAAGSYLEKTARIPLALRTYALLVERQPEDPAAFRALFRSGEILAKTGSTEEARAAFARARAHEACTDHLRQAVDRALADVPSRLARRS
jgi:membrane associated rhomboid family serine protease